MGCRANVHFVQDNGEKIYFYTHWNGDRLPKIVAKALDRGRVRWHDDAYLARIIFCEMTQDDVLGTTGYGISTYWYDTDPENTDVIVDVRNQTVEMEGKAKYSFSEFVRLYGDRDEVSARTVDGNTEVL